MNTVIGSLGNLAKELVFKRKRFLPGMCLDIPVEWCRIYYSKVKLRSLCAHVPVHETQFLSIPWD